MIDEKTKTIKKIITTTLICVLTLSFVAVLVSLVAAPISYGVVSLTFDDNTKNQFTTVYPMLKQRGLTGTFYIVTNHIADLCGNSDYMTIENMHQLENDGNEIGSHSVTHSNMVKYTDQQITYELTESKRILESYGFKVSNFAYPYGITSPKLIELSALYYASGRTTYNQVNAIPPQRWQYVLNAYRGEYTDGTSVTKFKAAVNEAISKNRWTIFYFHNVVSVTNSQPYCISTAQFTECLNYLVSTGVRVKTVADALNCTTTSAPTASTITVTISIKQYSSDVLYTTMTYNLKKGTEWNAPTTVTMSGVVWDFKCWTDGYTGLSRVFNSNGTYSLYYVQK